MQLEVRVTSFELPITYPVDVSLRSVRNPSHLRGPLGRRSEEIIGEILEISAHRAVRLTIDRKKLEHGCGFPPFLGLGLEDKHVSTF